MKSKSSILLVAIIGLLVGILLWQILLLPRLPKRTAQIGEDTSQAWIDLQKTLQGRGPSQFKKQPQAVLTHKLPEVFINPIQGVYRFETLPLGPVKYPASLPFFPVPPGRFNGPRFDEYNSLRVRDRTASPILDPSGSSRLDLIDFRYQPDSNF